MDTIKKISLTLLLIASACLAQSCTTAVTSGAQAAYDHHNINSTLYDQRVAMQVDHAIRWKTDRYKTSRVSVSVFNNTIVLTGQVISPDLQSDLVSIAKATAPDVEEVYNLTTVSTPTSSLTHVNDAWITAKIKAQLVANNDINPSEIKVITENGTVYLIGIVFPQDADIATQIAKSTSGVQNVVRVFSYLHISKKANA
jgi:osmotically-inducible protein OsmY